MHICAIVFVWCVCGGYLVHVCVYVHACVCMTCIYRWVRGKRGRQTYRSNHFTDQDDRGLSGCTGWQDPAAVQFKQKLRTGVNINPSTMFSAECETWIFSPYTDERFTSRRTPNISSDWEEISNCLLKKKSQYKPGIDWRQRWRCWCRDISLFLLLFIPFLLSQRCDVVPQPHRVYWYLSQKQAPELRTRVNASSSCWVGTSQSL